MKDIDEYLKAALETYEAEHPDPIAYAAVGLGGEAGEVLNQVQKIMRGDDGLRFGRCHLTAERQEKLKGELGGVAWFFVVLCFALELKPSEVLAANVEKLRARLEDGTIRGDGDER